MTKTSLQVTCLLNMHKCVAHARDRHYQQQDIYLVVWSWLVDWNNCPDQPDPPDNNDLQAWLDYIEGS